ncbi:acyltransferase [Virgibacillus sp. MSP4-1]|uniref:acyltransferase n=1 Tax=Virgibacillus sp. MSP4-1 TaxID=2700081 RepID=UPI0006944C3C|nr:acyltransferase [Virgibacillus sp. MSP4-1]QHS23489.1 acyltransferase [Virgibacillus sp. MSP4-1]
MISILVFLGKLLFKIKKIMNKLIHLYLQNFYKRKMKNIGRGVYFNGISQITGIQEITVGNNVHIGNNAYIRAEGGLYIGDNTHISRNVVIYTHNHNYEGELLPYDKTHKFRKVLIEENVWIGINVVILPGTHIKEGAIIGAGAVVSGVVDKCGIYGAHLSTKINSRDVNHYERLKIQRAFGGKQGKPLQ